MNGPTSQWSVAPKAINGASMRTLSGPAACPSGVAPKTATTSAVVASTAGAINTRDLRIGATALVGTPVCPSNLLSQDITLQLWATELGRRRPDDSTGSRI